MILKKFDPVIYPQKLFVFVGKDFKELNGLFTDLEDGEFSDIDFGKFKNFQAVTLKVHHKETKEYGVVIAFLPKFFDCTTIAHESSHAAGYICYHIGMDMDCGEPTAYLIGWIANCCWSLKKKQ